MSLVMGFSTDIAYYYEKSFGLRSYENSNGNLRIIPEIGCQIDHTL